MGNAITSDARVLWLMLRNSGLTWTASQLTHHWRPTFSVGEVQAMLDALHAGHFVAINDKERTPTYFVNHECLPLPGLALKQEDAREQS